MRISWYSNHPFVSTGYGQQTAEVVPRIKALGHDIAVLANYGQTGYISTWGDTGIPIFPSGKDKFSNDIIDAHHALWRGDWLISLYDVWPLRREMFPPKVASWVPVDHSPVPPEVVAWCRTVRTIAMSRFGQREFRAAGIEAAYIPHSVNTAVYKPTTATEAGTIPRRAMGVPDDHFLVMIAAANQGAEPPRKAWPQMFEALAIFMRSRADVHVYLHTDPVGIGGIDLQTLSKAVGMPPDRVHWADAYALVTGRIGQRDLAAIYSSADVLLATSMGEGFGIPVMEAQACGVPVIVSDFSAQPELVGGGWTVSGQRHWDAAQRAFFFMPYIDDIVLKLEDAYQARGTLSEQTIAKAAEYDSDRVFVEHWVPFLATLEETPAERKPNRAERRHAAAGGPPHLAAAPSKRRKGRAA